MKLTLRCHNSERGCESKFTLEACEGHVKDCLYEMIRCKNKPCKQMVLRRDMNDHELHDCSHRYVTCKKCGMKISLVVPQKHDCIRDLKKCLKGKGLEIFFVLFLKFIRKDFVLTSLFLCYVHDFKITKIIHFYMTSQTQKKWMFWTLLFYTRNTGNQDFWFWFFFFHSSRK